MDIKGNVGTSPVTYDVGIDGSLNVTLSVGYKDPGSAASISLVGAVPLASILAALVAKSKSTVLGEVEQMLVTAAEAYVNSQTPAAT